MKIISYNVNGIRAAMSKGLLDWLQIADPDVFCIQEIKAMPEQVDTSSIEALGYHHYWHPAQKKGYSGVAIFSKIKPDHVEYGMGMKEYDFEGRVIRADFGDLSIVNIYFPSGSSGDHRQVVKMAFLNDIQRYLAELRLRRPRLVVSGDYNICHRPIDIHNPERNKKTSGFLPEERDWMSDFLDAGFIDTFRHFDDSPHKYSWWSYRSGARKRNLGWRIDYHMATENLHSELSSATILDQVVHSDHCPIVLEIR